MWSTKEVFILSLATGLAFCFATIYAQRRIQRYIDNKVTEKSANPLSRLVPNEPARPLGQSDFSEMNPNPPQKTVNHDVPIANPREEKRFHDSPPGSGERWTPLEIN